ncbi:MAG: ribosome biogenesis GTPase Der [Micavibrio sp.]|nr:MAG: ribosome biogenesis GTPase Der [Micavibrio sp.]
MSLNIVIIGRPNVGKSTLFNRMAGKKLSIVDDTPGITRDWRSAEADFMGLKFRITDTAGLEEHFDDSIAARMRKSTENALKQADFVLFMIDARAGLTSLDRHFAEWIRKQNIPCALVANKCESSRGDGGMYEAFELGLGSPVAISAEHGIGFTDLYDVLAPLVKKYEEDAAAAEDEDEDGDDGFAAYEEGSGTGFGDEEAEEEDTEKPVKLAIVGRPNAGKSTLLNTLLGEDRAMTGAEPGITRDAVSVDWEYEGRKFRLVDTAGIRKKAKIIDKIEKISVTDSFRAIRLAQVVVMLVEPDSLLERQDLAIAAHVIEEGRALVIAINKWDAAEKKDDVLEHAAYKLETALPQVKDVPVVTISALRGTGLKKLMRTVEEAYRVWNARVPTGALNRWLSMMESKHPPPMVQRRPNRLRYMTQVKARPPTFALWLSRPKDLPDSYQRYLVNGLRESFAMPGTPIRLILRTSKNPYVN